MKIFLKLEKINSTIYEVLQKKLTSAHPNPRRMNDTLAPSPLHYIDCSKRWTKTEDIQKKVPQQSADWAEPADPAGLQTFTSTIFVNNGII